MRAPILRSAVIACALATVAVLASVAALRLGAPATTHAGPVTIDVGDQWFCDASFQNGVCETAVAAGTTVSWDFSGAGLPHTTTECGVSCTTPTGSPLWSSGTVNDGTFEFTFETPGTYLYRCNIHPTAMRGRIVVEGAAADTPTPTSTPVGDTPPPPTATSTPTSGAGIAGDANDDGLVNAIDATLVLQLVADFLPSLPSSADANANGVTDAIDAALILQFSANLIAQLPP